MRKPLPVRYRPLVVCVSLLGLVGSSRADSLVTVLVGDAPPGQSYRAGAPGAAIAFRSQRSEVEGGEEPGIGVVPAPVWLTLILVMPAGMTASTLDANNTSTNNSSSLTGGKTTGGDGDGGGGGHHTPNVAPEPGSLLTGLIGAAVAGLAGWRRCRRCEP